MAPWPADFSEQRSGRGCPFCDQGRLEETPFGIRFFAGTTCDAYLQRAGFRRGYAVVVHRGDRHVTEPTELAPDEAQQFWAEILHVTRAIEQLTDPHKINLLLLGNAVPHLHAHVVPRYEDDPDAGGPPVWIDPPPVHDEEQVRRDVVELRRLV